MGIEMTCCCLAILIACLVLLLRWKPASPVRHQMTFEEANTLMEEVAAFLVTCGGVYETGITGDLQGRILFCLATEQYLLERDRSGGISYFYSYWKIWPEDARLVREGGDPAIKVQGSMLCIVDFGNLNGEASAKKAEQVLKQREGNLPITLYNHAGMGR